MSNCPLCHGTGFMRLYGIPEPNSYEANRGVMEEPCPNEGCHGGHIHCCEGDQAEGDEDELGIL